MKITLKHCCIADVRLDNETPDRRVVILQVNEEDLFNMLDNINPKSIIKYLDMRGIQHREPSIINIYQSEKQCNDEHNKRKIARIKQEQERLKQMLEEKNNDERPCL